MEKSNEPAVDLMFAMAKRAGELANEPINALRISAGTQDTPSASIRELQHQNRGQLIEDLLIEEFEERAKEIDHE